MEGLRRSALRACLWMCMGAAALLAGPYSQAAETAAAASWASLNPSQRAALGPLRRDWDRMDAPRRQKWLEVAARFDTMNADERARVQDRMTEWARLSPAERARARVQFQEARQVPATELQSRWQAYQSLPEEEKQRLASQRLKSAAKPAPALAAARSTASPSAKTNLVPIGASPQVRSAGAAQLQVRPGATTTPIGSPPSPPPHNQAGLPKIAAMPGFVDSTTLLPKRGPQGAAAAGAPAPAKPPATRP